MTRNLGSVSFTADPPRPSPCLRGAGGGDGAPHRRALFPSLPPSPRYSFPLVALKAKVFGQAVPNPDAILLGAKTMTGENLEKVFQEAAEKEKEYAKELEEEARRLPNPVIRVLLESIAEDSYKHSKLYTAALEVVQGKVGMISRRELEDLRRAVRKHIEEEARMVKLARELADSTDNPRLKLILEAIYEDELRHHSLLVAIEKYLEKYETIEEDEFWEQVWRESRWESRHRTIGPRAEHR